jgi:hypothetical protein
VKCSILAAIPSLLILGGAACSRDRSPHATADYFIDKYYIEIDPVAALEVAEGDVADRLKKERVLVATAQSQGVGPTQVLPRVFYTAKSETSQEGSTRMIYDVSIDSGGNRFHKEVTLIVAKRANSFRITGWTEHDDASMGLR